MQDWVKTGLPPVQPDGELESTVLVLILSMQALHFEYLKEVHSVASLVVQDWVKTGLPPVQPDGELESTVLV